MGIDIFFESDKGECTSIKVESAILIKTNHGLQSIKLNDYSDDCIKNALARYTNIDESRFQCLTSSMSYGIYAVKEKNKRFPIKKWSAPTDSEYKHTFVVKYIKTL